MKNLVKKVGFLFKKAFWLSEKNKKDIEREAKKNWDNNQSALMRHIISTWFSK